MDKKFYDRADRFVGLANEMAGSMEPEEVGDALLYATARYMAFLTVRATAGGGQGNRGLMREQILASMDDALRHHLAQMGLPETEPAPNAAPLGAPQTIDPTDPDELALAESYDRIGRAFSMLDIVLAAYLRGAGEQEAADSVTRGALQSHPDGGKGYLGAVYRLWESGLLSEAIAAYVIEQLCTMLLLENSATGYVKDPALDRDSKESHVRLFTSFGLHHFATVMRKDPTAFAALSRDGMAALLGDAAVKLEIAATNLRKRKHGR